MNLPEGVTLQWERLPAISKDLLPLFRQHWQETSQFAESHALDPAWGKLFQYDLLGLLRVFTARCDGLLVGYVFLFLSPSLNSETILLAHIERIYIAPEHRAGWLGVHLFKGAEAMAREVHAASIHVAVKPANAGDKKDLGVILRRLGYKIAEVTYAKVL